MPGGVAFGVLCPLTPDPSTPAGARGGCVVSRVFRFRIQCG